MDKILSGVAANTGKFVNDEKSTDEKSLGVCPVLRMCYQKCIFFLSHMSVQSNKAS